MKFFKNKWVKLASLLMIITGTVVLLIGCVDGLNHVVCGITGSISAVGLIFNVISHKANEDNGKQSEG